MSAVTIYAISVLSGATLSGAFAMLCVNGRWYTSDDQDSWSGPTHAIVRKALVGHWGIVKDLRDTKYDSFRHNRWTWRPTKVGAAHRAERIRARYRRKNPNIETAAEDVLEGKVEDVNDRQVRRAIKDLQRTEQQLKT